MTRWQLPVLFVGAVFLLGYSSASPRSPLPPAKALGSFQLADANLVIELVVAEPAVVSPVAMAWDEDGRLFVAEMADYPAAAGGGRIKLLEDRDCDGKYERVSVFADQLPFPNGVLPYKGGVLVTAAPNIWYLRDRDGDGRADERRVLFTGFGEGNQQLRVNGLHWGLDNWVYGANGRSDGDIRPGTGGEGKPVSIRRRDFRFRPDTLAFAAIAGFSQFGLPRDDWGRRFPSWNTVPLRHVVLEERYLSRNPYLAETTSVANILDGADAGRVYPISPPPQTFNREPLDYFNASCGPTIYRGDRLGKEYAGNAFVCESLLNLVHRRVLTPAGPTLVARRAEQGKEFLASTDPWFHPVNLATGPDGALYVADFYRQWVEHPQFVPAGLRQSVDFRRGHGHGRIWRIRHKDMAPGAVPRLGKATVAELVETLGHGNGWRRDTAQRLLVERQDRLAVPLLQKAARRATLPLARLHALWTLQGLQALDEETLLSALHDSHPGVREQGLRLVEGRSQTPALQSAVLALAGDAEVRVRFQCALALGNEPAAPARDSEAWKALAQIAQRDAADGWVRLAVLSSLGPKAWPFLQVLLEQKTAWLGNPTEEQAQFLRQVGALIGTGRREEELAALCNWVAQAQESPGQLPLILLAGLAEGLARSGQALPGLLAKPPAHLAKPLQGLEPQLAAARNLAMADKETARQRVLAWQVLLLAQPQIAADLLLKLLQPTQPPSLQTAAARGLAQVGSQALAARALDLWQSCTIQTRREILASLLRSAHLAAVLMDAVEQEKIAAVELDAVARDALFRIPDAALQKRVRTLFKQETASNRQEVVRKYQPALALTGNRQRGAEVFAKHCQTCHQLQGQGQRVGPDLSAVASRPREVLLQDLLDPSKEIAPDFMNFVLVTKGGQVLTGLLAAETATGVKLRRAEGAEDTVLRSEIQELRATGKSLMPEGLEQQLSLQNVADLLAFLRQRGR